MILACLAASVALAPAHAVAHAKRIALLIQNDLYPDAEPPKTVDQDASTLAAQLKRDGFEVDLKTNLGRQDLRSSVDAFVTRATTGSVALLYFKGIGLQASRLNYLIPVDASIWSDSDIRRQGTSLDAVMSDLDRRGARVKIAIVDGARPNPFERRFRMSAAGLAPLASPGGSLVIFSEALNTGAGPEAGPLSPFMNELVKQMRTAGDAEEAFTRTREDVSNASKGRALPWVSSTLVAPFRFAAETAEGGNEPGAPSRPTTAATGSGNGTPTSSGQPGPKPPPVTARPPNVASTASDNNPKPAAPSEKPATRPEEQKPGAPSPPTASAGQGQPPSSAAAPPAPPPAASRPPDSQAKPKPPPPSEKPANPPTEQEPGAPAPPVVSEPSGKLPATPSVPSVTQPPPAASSNAAPPGAGGKPETTPPSAPHPAPKPSQEGQAGPKPSPPALHPGGTFSDCTNCPDMTVLAGGPFKMGSGATPFDRPVHDVTIARPFAMARFVVTRDEWALCVGKGGCKYHPDSEDGAAGNDPVVGVNWFDAKQYTSWLSKKTGKSYRLPTEAEWEYAARGGTTTTFPWSDTVGVGHANCTDCGSKSGRRAVEPVGNYPQNGFGLFDMAGNVAQWLEDCWALTYRDAPADGSASSLPNCKMRVVRGGSFETSAAYIKPTARFRAEPETRSRSIGFRVARDLK